MLHYFAEDCLENWIEFRLLAWFIEMGKNMIIVDLKENGVVANL